MFILDKLFGFLCGRILERRRRIKALRSICYEEAWPLIQNVNGVIQRGEEINDQQLMKSIPDKYICHDIVDFLLNYVRSEDKHFRKLLVGFVANMMDYVDFLRSDYDREIKSCKEASNRLTNEIYEKIIRLLAK